MYLSWRARLQQEPTLRDIKTWPVIEVDSLPEDDRKGFLRNRQIVARVLAHHQLKRVARAFNLTGAAISQLMARCLEGNDSQTPPLTEGLIPHRRVHKSKRRAPLPSLVHPSGARCAFEALLDVVPGLRDGLDEFIQKALAKSEYAQPPTPLAFFGEFKRLLKVANHPNDQYPYTSSDCGYETLRQYLSARTSDLQLTKRVKKEQKQTQTLLLTSQSSHRHYRALQNIQIDEKDVDFQGRITIAINDELIPLRAGRGTLLIAYDADIYGYLGYHLAYTDAPNQQDMLALIEHCIRPWQPMTLTTPGLEYVPGACFPSGLPNGFPISFGTVHLDNAWLHRAKSVRGVIADTMAATVHVGKPEQPLARNWVEESFAYIDQHHTHRFPSTTGSHPHDPMKESRNNAKKVPQVSMQTFIETLDVLLTDANITPLPQLAAQSPLDIFKYHVANHYIRYVPDMLRSRFAPFETEMTLPIKARNDSTSRHINFYGVRYSRGIGLTQAALRGERVTVRFDRRDIRVLRAYDAGGNFLDLIYAPRSWQRYPHSVATRQIICKYIREQRMHGDDPLANFMHLLLNNKHHPDGALQLLRFYTEFSAGANALILPAEGDIALPETSANSPDYAVTWTPATANRRILS